MTDFLIFNTENEREFIKNDSESLAKAVSYYGNTLGKDILVTNVLDLPVFDTFGGFINKVYDSSFDLMAYQKASMEIAGEFIENIDDCIVKDEEYDYE